MIAGGRGNLDSLVQAKLNEIIPRKEYYIEQITCNLFSSACIAIYRCRSVDHYVQFNHRWQVDSSIRENRSREDFYTRRLNSRME